VKVGGFITVINIVTLNLHLSYYENVKVINLGIRESTVYLLLLVTLSSRG
jgi:hypothetical protein